MDQELNNFHGQEIFVKKSIFRSFKKTDIFAGVCGYGFPVTGDMVAAIAILPAVLPGLIPYFENLTMYRKAQTKMETSRTHVIDEFKN